MDTKYLIGYDIGSSSIKASIINAFTGETIYSTFSPKEEMSIDSPEIGWAEQDPEVWWNHLVTATHEMTQNCEIDKTAISGIGISYQMHGLVLIDKDKKVLRPSIIWCDSRAVEYGDKAFGELGNEYCLSNLLNSPGNFTASKLKWVKENQPEIYNDIYKILLPGDYIALKLTGEARTTISGLSEGVFWDYKKADISTGLLEYYGLKKEHIADIVPTFGIQGRLTDDAAAELSLVPGIIIGYRAGDQPNNAFSLNVLNPGEVAATAGTSGVIYGVTDKITYDPQSRVNSFAHVNYSKDNPILGVLLCINGTGILNSWMRGTILDKKYSYHEMNELAESVPIGADGLMTIPFGNGAERVLANKDVRAQFVGFNFNKHKTAHIFRSIQEGIVYSFKYGLDIMHEMGLNVSVVRAGNANMFLSPLFCEALSNTCNISIELYNSDGSIGAARGAGVGAGIYKDLSEAFNGFEKIRTYTPDKQKVELYTAVYKKWEMHLNNILKN
ncbi:MAG: carbohydrate kinase [Melioribacteraceae bacterium]|nr:carbohydrate kinase [Melioribacteraceae bacterium]